MVVETPTLVEVDIKNTQRSGCRRFISPVVWVWNAISTSPQTLRYDDNAPLPIIDGKVAYGPKGKPQFPDFHRS